MLLDALGFAYIPQSLWNRMKDAITVSLPLSGSLGITDCSVFEQNGFFVFQNDLKDILIDVFTF